MDGNLQNKASLGSVNVMVVDDDVISLSIVAGILKMLKYDQVVTATNARDALAILQQRTNFYQLVITDVHMPVMDGFEFQMKVREEFNLPVVMMSADEKETSIVRGLDGGAAFYIVKPVKYDDLRNLWQYAISSRKVKSSRDGSLVRNSPLNDDQKQNKRDTKSKAPIQVKEGNEKERIEVVPKKRKVLWTTALHNRFLEAIRKIGLERAVPKRILENMNVAGLTRENVASHLQKYRIFLKRVTEASISNGSGQGMDIMERSLRSSLAAGQPPWVFRALQHGFPEFLDHQQLGSSPQSAYQENILIANGPSHRNAIFPNQQDCNQQQNLGNTNPLYLAYGLDVTSHQTQGRSELLPTTMPKFTAVGDPGTNNSYPEMNIAGSGQMGFADGEISSGFGCSYGLRNGDDENTTQALLGNLNSGYCPPDAYSFSELGITNQFPPRFSHVIQEEYNPPMLGNISPPKFAEPGLNELNLNQLNSPSYNEQQVGEELQNNGYIIHPNPLQQNNPGSLSSFNQRQWDGGMNGYDFGNGMDKFNENFLSWNQSYPNQQQGGRALLDTEPYSGYSDVNQARNQGVGDDILNSIFGPSAY